MKVIVLVEFAYDLPDSTEERLEFYGTADEGECVKIDLENDPVAFLAETDFRVVSYALDPALWGDRVNAFGDNK